MIRLTLVALATATLAGCVSFSQDGGMGEVSDLTKERTGQAVQWQRSQADSDAAGNRSKKLLASPLTPDAAVELALLNNRGLQANLAELGISEADLVQAGRPKNPMLSFGRIAGPGVLEVDRSVMFGVLDLLTVPAATGVARQRFERAQIKAAMDAVSLASQVRKTYFEAVAAQQLIQYFRQVKDAADASADLARRMAAAGNFSKLDQMHEQAFYADATSQLARAQQQATAQREQLTRLMGLAGDQINFQLPDRLPELPKAVIEPANAQQTAMDRRLDVLMAKRDVDATARSLGLNNATRFANALDVGYQNKSQTGTPNEQGFEVQVEVPLFDFGGARTARARARYMQAVDRTAQIAVNAQSEVRESYSAYRTTYDLAKHYRDEVVPLRKRIQDENLLRYNGMLIGVFELIADARDQVTGVTDYVKALRDYWVADANLQAALTAGSPDSNSAASAGSAQMSSTTER
jgi:outer membrane protein TolC